MASTLVERMTGKKYASWIGVDFDGTLAHHKRGDKGPGAAGEPVKPMLDRVLKWLDKGKTVKIFTARAINKDGIDLVKKWLKKHGLPDLEVTNVKDPGMEKLWDDKAVGVRRNTGKRIGESIVDKLLENKWNPKGLRRDHRGRLLDRWGREMEIDWDEFEKKRLDRPDDYPKWPKVLNPEHAAANPKRPGV